MTESPYPAWFTVADAAKFDDVTRTFTDRAWDHRLACPTCAAKQPCPDLSRMIDEAAAATSAIGNEAFARYSSGLESKYSHRDYWTRGEST